MNHHYIKVPAIYKKMKMAETEAQPIYLSAPVGFGKTAAVKYYYRKKAVKKLSGESGMLSEMPERKNIWQSTVIIDDITWITDQESKDYIIRLLEERSKHVVMLGRARLPEWLKELCIGQYFILADEKDFSLDVELTGRLLESYQVKLSEEQIQQIAQDTMGHALCIMMIAYQMQNKENYTESVREATRIDVFHYYNHVLYEKWSTEMRELLMAVSNFQTFQVKLAEMVTGSSRIEALLAEAMSVGDFLIRHEDGIYEMRKMLRLYFLWKQSLEQDKSRQMEIYKRAALYYEIMEDITKSLHFYELAGEKKEISRLLNKNAEKHPGTGHYFETREYYLNLPEKEIKRSPVLMAGISMLYSLMLQPKMSEQWYERIKSFEAKAVKGSNEKKEAKKRLFYLDIALPHRGTIRMIDILRGVAVMITTKNIGMPEFSVTSNLPSIMNGGKDFCQWSKSDRELAKMMKKPVELILGKYGAGLVNIALAESFFEKGNTDLYEVLTLLNSGYVKADTRGKIEMCFAAIGIMCKVHVWKNQLVMAQNQLAEFKEKAKAQGAERLLPNIITMEIWMNLLEGKNHMAEKWLKTQAPNENREFYILDRYRYLMKIRTYLALGRNEEAATLINRLQVYFIEYRRTYMRMENEVLKAIMQYRMKIEQWRNTLSEVLKDIEEYHFLYLISKEGIAIRPLLQDMDKLSVSKEFEQELCSAVDNMAVNYPNYMLPQNTSTEELTDMEKKILNLYCQGVGTQKICDLCKFTYNTLKYHNRNLYRKLGVKNRAEAERKAKELLL